MADSTQVIAGTPNKVDINIPTHEAQHIHLVTVDVTSYAEGGFPRVDTPPDPIDATASFQLFFDSLIGYSTNAILGVDIVSGAAVVARYDDLLDTVKLFNVDPVVGDLVEIADAVDVGEVRLRVWYN